MAIRQEDFFQLTAWRRKLLFPGGPQGRGLARPLLCQEFFHCSLLTLLQSIKSFNIFLNPINSALCSLHFFFVQKLNSGKNIFPIKNSMGLLQSDSRLNSCIYDPLPDTPPPLFFGPAPKIKCQKGNGSQLFWNKLCRSKGYFFF